MKKRFRAVLLSLGLLFLLAQPAFAAELGEPNITPQTTMRELRENPSLKASGYYTYCREMLPIESNYWNNKTLAQYAKPQLVYDCADAMNLVIENYNKGVQVTWQVYTPEEIAEKMGLPVERVREIQKISQEPVSLETPIGEEEDSHLGDFIQDDNVPVPAEAAAFTLLKEQLVEVLGTLTEREQKVLCLRFGLEDGRARTLEEVGKEFDVTRERIRQIEAKALRKLRHPSRSRKLKDYLD